ncbi:hypothetical protein [Amycolatopsis sp. NPDC050768]|uniref:hypothetical protein n=1 Tax=Amycolatopsis sp. NPDC050768 TaxID=3154839 RepID=UPI0033EA7B7C
MTTALSPFVEQVLPAAVLAVADPDPPRGAALVRGGGVTALVRRAEAEQSPDAAFRAEAAQRTGRDPDIPDGVPTIAFGPPPDIPGLTERGVRWRR